MKERMKIMKKILKSLPFQLLLGVIIGIVLGLISNEAVMNVIVTIKFVLGELINFCVPLIVIGFIATLQALKPPASESAYAEQQFFFY